MALDGTKVKEIIHVEGEMTKIPYKGIIKPIIHKLLGGLASGMTYVGARNIESLKGKADFIKISDAGYRESQAHGLV
jgi:IMP dehydrogenase